MEDMSKLAKGYDARSEHEYNRLSRHAYNSLEQITNLHFIKKYVKKGNRVLDAGGGPGKYLLDFSKLGFKTTILDISKGNIKYAKSSVKNSPKSVQNKIENFIVGDVRKLDMFDSNSFDSVLSLGATLSHIPTEKDRIKAIKELVRVVKVNSYVFISVVGFYSVLKTVPFYLDGDICNPDYDLLYKTGDDFRDGIGFHFYKAEELKKQAKKCGLEIIEMYGCESLSSNLVDQTNLLAEDKKKWKKWKEIVIEMANVPAVVDNSSHFVLIGRKVKNAE
ncbi:MAG: methyltransferase domain-containing protein [Candidatus Delongbacteria bacterium]|nr:methyltransferase domain-containing protein [Candidatus Delongbacteria bacterium]